MGLAKQHGTQNRQYNEEIQSPIKPSLNDTDEQISKYYLPSACTSG